MEENIIFVSMNIFFAFVCNAIVFYYSSKIFKKRVSIYFLGVVSLLNVVFYVLFFEYSVFSNAPIVLGLFYLAIFVEFKLFFSGEYLKVLFSVLFFGSYMLSFYNICLSVLSIFESDSSYYIYENETNLLYVKTATYFVMSIFLLLLSKIKSLRYLRDITSNEVIIKFAVGILGVTNFYLIFSGFAGNIHIENYNMGIFYFKVGVACLLVSSILLLFSNIFSRFLAHKNKVDSLQSEISNFDEKIESLHKEKNIDFLTEVFTRDVAEEKINMYLIQGKPFTVIFLDIDGLKYANDKFGHNEGDFYIKEVSKIVSDSFEDDIVSRFGGDEFIVVCGKNDENEVNLKVQNCYQNVKMIKKRHKKPYSTSISYGMVKVRAESRYSYEQIVELADERMYTFKKQHKKQRDN